MNPIDKIIELLRQLSQLEMELHKAETRRNQKHLDLLLHTDFEEFGRSGRRYSRAEVLAEFSSSADLAQVHAQDFELVRLEVGVALLTYRSAHIDAEGNLYRWTLRSSLWIQTGKGWQLRFHQGTPTEEFVFCGTMEIRNAEAEEIEQLAKLWYDGWQDAHARVLPAELARHRTLESFKHRLHSALPNVRVAGAVGQPLGLSIIRDDELYQFYVSANARGSGLAAKLLADAEARLIANGVETAWLACAIGNERAARFYEKNGWRRVGNLTNQLETPDGLFLLDVWRYEKELPQPDLRDI